MNNSELPNTRVPAGVALRRLSPSRMQHMPVILLETLEQTNEYATRLSACRVMLLDFHDEGRFISYRILGDADPNGSISVLSEATRRVSLKELASFNVPRAVHGVLLDKKHLLPLWAVVLIGEERAHETLVSSRSGAVYHHQYQPLSRHEITTISRCGT